MSTTTDPNIIWTIVILFCVVFGTASVIACWCCCYHTCLKPCGVGPWGAGNAWASPDFGRSVNPISTRRDILCPPNNTGTPGFSDLPMGGIYKEIQNQTKQLNSLQHLVLDLKNSQSSKQNAEKVETELIANCVFCLDKTLTHAVRPCGHLIACTDCVEKLPKECPICRRTISDTLRIFFP